MAALSDAPGLQVRGVVAIYSPTDLVALARNSTYIPQWVRENLQTGALGWFITSRLQQLSPAAHVRRDMPPFLLIHGTNDQLVPFSQSQIMCDRMRAAGAQCDLYPVQGAGHGIRWWEDSPSLSAAYKREMARWLRDRLGG